MSYKSQIKFETGSLDEGTVTNHEITHDDLDVVIDELDDFIDSYCNLYRVTRIHKKGKKSGGVLSADED